jgi:hypothetical protein
MIHRPTGITAEASERRSQAENHSQAVARLRIKLAVAVRTSQDGQPLAPSNLWRERCRTGRIAVNTGHEDYPALLAEALDIVTAADFDVAAAAELLQTSPTQLARFLQREPAAWKLVSDERRGRGLRPLR